MIILRAQFEVFEGHARVELVRRIARHVRDEHDDVLVRLPRREALIRELDPGLLEALAQSGIERARGYGIDDHQTLLVFVVLMFVVAPNFDQHPLVQRILNDEGWPPNERVDRLMERASDKNWEGAAARYDVHAWAVP